MGYEIGYDDKWNRDIGYGVPAICDEPECTVEIDRGLAYVCGSDAFGGEHGCGLFFCSAHRFYVHRRDSTEERMGVELCSQCKAEKGPFSPKPDTAEWMNWKLIDSSWQRWRDENPLEIEQLQAAVATRHPSTRNRNDSPKEHE